MFGIGLTEFILIFLLIILVVGPEQLPDVVRKGVAFIREARRHLADIKQTVDEQTAPLRQPLQEMKDEISRQTHPVQNVSASVDEKDNSKDPQ